MIILTVLLGCLIVLLGYIGWAIKGYANGANPSQSKSVIYDLTIYDHMVTLAE